MDEQQQTIKNDGESAQPEEITVGQANGDIYTDVIQEINGKSAILQPLLV
ncbi:MAG: hypothetical protein VYB50_06625 [Candidatus Thermoplasmatota archaeon]|nr:hypothetical protein [Candidatus Thermoplasmatota archaeon]